jgi:hypothetical protein
MTVGELLAQLEYMPQNLEIGKFYEEDRDGPAMFIPFRGVEIVEKKVHDLQEDKLVDKRFVKFKGNV